MKNLKRISEPIKANSNSAENVAKVISASLNSLCLNETPDVDRVVSECVADMLAQLELSLDIEGSGGGGVRFELETSGETREYAGEASDEEEENESSEENCGEEKVAMAAENEMIFDDCVQLLKDLFHTFVTSHLFELGGGEQVKSAFQALFNCQNW